MKITMLILFYSVVFQAHANRLEEWQTRVAEGRIVANQMNLAAKSNGQLVELGRKVDCSRADTVRSMVLEFPDGKASEYVLVGVDAYTWIDRNLKVAKIENGIPIAQNHKVVFSVQFNGWRWEREPEKAHLGARYDRFANVSAVKFQESSLQKLAGCTPATPTPGPKLESPVLSSDVVGIR